VCSSVSEKFTLRFPALEPHERFTTCFLRVLELLMRPSGGMLNVTKLATESQISRPTVTNWLEVYQITHVALLIKAADDGAFRCCI
jgi:hypothetical protein